MMDKRLLRLVPQAMRHVAATVAWQWIGLMGNVAMVWAIASELAALVAGEAAPQATSGIAPLLTLLLLAAGIIARTVATRAAARQSFAASQDVKRTLRRRIYQKLLQQGPGYTKNVSTAEVVQLAVEGCEQLETYFGQYLPQLFYAVLAPVTLFIVVAPLSLPAAATLLACVPLIPATIVAVQKIAKRILAKYWDQYAELGDSFLENLQGLTTLKIYQADAARHRAMNAEAERFRRVTMAVLSMQLNSIIVMDIVALGGAVAGIAVALASARTGGLGVFGCLFIVLISADFFLPMRQLGSYFHVAMNGIAASAKIFKLLDLPEPPARTLGLDPTQGVELKQVSFAYTQDRPVLTSVNIKVPSTGLVAVVGESGSGKSTVASLIAGAHDGYTGDVLVGGSPVRDIDRAELARQVTVVGLGARLFQGSVRENLLMARPESTDAQLWEVLETARLAEFLRSQEGLDTQLTENAANLSGGQRQRLALARAVLHNSAIYVFDEATSNVDVESEEAILAAIRKLARSRAVVMISHRLANAVDADCIYVLERGQVAGAGTHGELLRGCETYRSLWQAQIELEQFAAGATRVAGAADTSGAAGAGSAEGAAGAADAEGAADAAGAVGASGAVGTEGAAGTADAEDAMPAAGAIAAANSNAKEANHAE